MTVELPPRPSENSDPWYNTRETYDSAIEREIHRALKSRGVLPEGVHIDDAFGSEYHGIWHLNPNNNNPGLPFEVNTRAVLTVSFARYSSAQYQEIRHHNQFWWREASNTPPNSWGVWHRVASHEYVDEEVTKLTTAHLGLDTDGVPYYDPGNRTYQLDIDVDGLPYFYR